METRLQAFVDLNEELSVTIDDAKRKELNAKRTEMLSGFIAEFDREQDYGTKNESARNAAYRIFDIYCDERSMAECMLADPEGFIAGDQKSEDEVIESAEGIIKHTDNLLILARTLMEMDP